MFVDIVYRKFYTLLLQLTLLFPTLRSVIHVYSAQGVFLYGALGEVAWAVPTGALYFAARVGFATLTGMVGSRRCRSSYSQGRLYSCLRFLVNMYVYAVQGTGSSSLGLTLVSYPAHFVYTYVPFTRYNVLYDSLYLSQYLVPPISAYFLIGESFNF